MTRHRAWLGGIAGFGVLAVVLLATPLTGPTSAPGPLTPSVTTPFTATPSFSNYSTIPIHTATPVNATGSGSNAVRTGLTVHLTSGRVIEVAESHANAGGGTYSERVLTGLWIYFSCSGATCATGKHLFEINWTVAYRETLSTTCASTTPATNFASETLTLVGEVTSHGGGIVYGHRGTTIVTGYLAGAGVYHSQPPSRTIVLKGYATLTAGGTYQVYMDRDAVSSAFSSSGGSCHSPAYRKAGSAHLPTGVNSVAVY
jgi:hypothetical protein